MDIEVLMAGRPSNWLVTVPLIPLSLKSSVIRLTRPDRTGKCPTQRVVAGQIENGQRRLVGQSCCRHATGQVVLGQVEDATGWPATEAPGPPR